MTYCWAIDDVVGDPVQNQASREPKEEESKGNRHDAHNFGLQRIGWCWVQHLLDKHRNAHQQRQDEVRILHRQVCDPQEERRGEVRQILATPIKGQENRHLTQDKQQPLVVNFFFLVQIHHLF